MSDKTYNKVIINGTTIIDLTSDTVDASHLLYNYTAHNKSGVLITGSCTYDADTSDATATADQILATKTAYKNGSKITGTMTNRGGVTGTISDISTPYTIPQGYHDGSGTVDLSSAAKDLLIAGNIKTGVTILGVLGTYTGAGDLTLQSKTVTPTFSSQTITQDSGYYGLSSVTVAAITPVQTQTSGTDGWTLTINNPSS